MPFYEEFLSFLEKNFIENNTFYLLGNNQYLLTSTAYTCQITIKIIPSKTKMKSVKLSFQNTN